MDLSNPYPSSPGLYPLHVAARMAGIPIETFANACERGDVPIRLERLGARGLRFIRASELQDWLRADPATTNTTPDPFNP